MTDLIPKIKNIFYKTIKKIVRNKVKRIRSTYVTSTDTLLEYIKMQIFAFDAQRFIKTVKELVVDEKIASRHKHITAFVLELNQINKQLDANLNIKHIVGVAGFHRTSAQGFLTDLSGCYSANPNEFENALKEIEILIEHYKQISTGKDPVQLNNTFLLNLYLKEVSEILNDWLEFQ